MSVSHPLPRIILTLLCCLSAPAGTLAAAEVALRGQVDAVEFTSDHKLICRNTTDLLAGGERYPDVSWRRQPAVSAPITHTGGRDARICARISLRLSGAVADTPYLLKGSSAEPALCFQGEGTLPKDDTLVVDVVGVHPLGRPMRKLRQKIVWSLTLAPGTPGERRLKLGDTGPHVVYVTLGTPRNTDEPRSVVTDIRMDLVVERVAAAMKATDPEATAPWIVYYLMKQNGDDYLPNRHYTKDKAWKVPESWRMTPKGASCISIVEFVGLVCKMSGIEGEATTTAYHARPPKTRVALQGGLGDPPVTKKGPANETWQLFLVDETNSNLGQVGGVGGMNYYEAVLEYKRDGRKYYYPGGTERVFDTPEKVLKVFRTLAWATWDDQFKDWVVREVVETYVKPGENRPRSMALP